MNWKYGTIFGGSTPIIIKDKYISFFHSWIAETPEHRRSPRVYHIGVYSFSADPPNRILSSSKIPIWIEDFYSAPSEVMHKVIFPTSIILDKNNIILSYGENDAVTKLLEISLSELEGFFM